MLVMCGTDSALNFYEINEVVIPPKAEDKKKKTKCCLSICLVKKDKGDGSNQLDPISFVSK